MAYTPKVYKIMEVTNLTGLASSTLRYYESFGLLEKVLRDANGQRLYDECHLDRLRAIQCFKDSGMELAQIRAFFQLDVCRDEHIDEIIRLITDQKESLKTQIAKMQQQLCHLEHKERYYRAIRTAKETGAPMPCYEELACTSRK